MNIHIYAAILIFSHSNPYLNEKKQCADEILRKLPMQQRRVTQFRGSSSLFWSVAVSVGLTSFVSSFKISYALFAANYFIS